MKSFILLSTAIILTFFCTSLCAEFHFTSTVIDTTTPYYTGYFTSMSYTVEKNLYRDAGGVLHFAYVNNYELWYLRSEDDGQTWTRTKVPTEHDGDVRRAAITVNHDGKVFISFTCNNYFNYANPTGVSYSHEFHYDLYCSNNLNGSWVTEPIYAPSRSGFSDNYGPTVEAMMVDKYNNIHVFANRVGWYTYGGTAWEYVRNAQNNIWSSAIQVAHFSDQSVDHMIYMKFVALTDTSGDITLFFCRDNNFELLYVQNINGVWQAPVIVDNQIALAYNRFDAVITPENHIMLGYLKKNAAGNTELLIAKDLAAAQKANITFTDTDTLSFFNLHCDSENKITMRLAVKHRNNILLVSEDNGDTWSDLHELTEEEKKFMPNGINFVQTDTRRGYFSDCRYISFDVYRSGSQPYGPDTLSYATVSDKASRVWIKQNHPEDFRLDQNYPNPFNPKTVINYHIGEIYGSSVHINLSIFNMLGQIVTTLVSEKKPAGSYTVTWDASGLGSGVYLYRLVTDQGFVQTRKLVLLK